MFAPKRIVAVSLVVLSAAVAGTVSHVLTYRAAAAPAAADKPAHDLERAKKEWRDQEQRHAEEMVKVRLEAAELEDQLRIREQELRLVRFELGLVRKRIDSMLAKLTQPKVPQQLQAEEKELNTREQKLRAEVQKLRQKFFLVEEKMWQLAREQAFERDRMRPRLNAAEEKRGLEEGAPLQRRLQKVEHELDRLRSWTANDARDTKDDRDEKRGRREKVR